MFEAIDKYWRAANYLSLAHIYLKNNVLMKRKLDESDIKKHYSGHWGTSPGLNFIYAHLNNLIKKYKCKIQLIIGPGHAGNALLANLYLEGSLHKYYTFIKDDVNGIESFVNIEREIKGIRSEINPFYPGTIYDGGELGYSLAVAFGSVLDLKEAITVNIIGDGECETGSISAAWNCINCLSKNTGHVLPIIHMNNYKMGSRSLISQKNDNELCSIFEGLGYEVKIVKQDHKQMSDALEWALYSFKDSCLKEVFRNPLIILRSPKGWTAPKDDVICIENSIDSHKVPLVDIHENKYSFQYLEKWLMSYKPDELFNVDGSIAKNIKDLIPNDNLKMGLNKYSSIRLVFPDTKRFALDKSIGKYKNVRIINEYLKQMIIQNKRCFRIISPDELKSNLLDELTLFDDNVMEILNENICQGWMQGYNLTGRHSIMIGYEAFMPIISSMVSQYAKYLIQLEKVDWRTLKPSMNYLLTSVCWENTYSHQNPEFINSLMIQKNPYVQVYFPVDANTLLACTELSLKSEGYINIIVSSKNELPQYLSWEEAVKFSNHGYYIWNKNSKKPLITLVAIGDYCLYEMQQAIERFNDFFPGLSYRLVVLINLTKLCTWNSKGHSFDQNEFEEIFTEDTPLLILYHGYPLLINAILADRIYGREVIALGYQNKSTISANALRKMIMNECSRFHIWLNINKILFRKGMLEKNLYEINEQKLKEMIEEYQS